MEIQGRSAVVTGGGNGIGRAIALALAKEGANVAVADLEPDAAAAVAQEVEEQGVRALAVKVDVTDESQVERLADQAWSAFGSVELLFNNAGVIIDPKPLFATSAADFRWLFEVNIGGMLNGIRVFAPRFIESGAPARIVNTGSEHSFGVPHIASGLYTATKHAVLGLSDVLRREPPEHVGVSVLCPGLVSSSLWRAEERRPDELGGGEEVSEARGAVMQDYGMPAEEVARRAIQGVREESFFILTHAHVVEYARARWEEALGEFGRQVPRYEGDDVYDVNKVMAKVLGGAD